MQGKKLLTIFFVLSILFANSSLQALSQDQLEPKRFLDWETCPKSDPESPKLRHTWCPKPYRIMRFEEGQEPFARSNPDDYCKVCKEPEPDKKYCASSGLIANPYCPSVTTEPPLPTETCAIHKKPEPEIPQLRKEFRVPEIYKKLGYPIYAGAFFCKDLGISHADFTWEEAKKFIDKIARENLSNTIRMFGMLAYPSCNYPHPEKANGKYDLNTINPVWYAQLHKTIAYCVERGIMVRLVMFDEHSYNRRWAYHWTNPRLNDGFGKADGKLYPLWEDKYLHTKWSNYCLRDANGRCDADCRERYCTSMEYLFWFYRQTIQPLNEEFGDMIAFESNEINAGSFWHEDIGKLLSKEFGIPRWRMITSQVGGVDWINGKPMIRKYWIPEEHGVATEAIYDEVYAVMGSEANGDKYGWIWSWDGKGGRWWVDNWDELRRIYSKSLRNKGRGCGGNNWLMNNDLDFDHIDYRSGEVIRDETFKFLGIN